MDQRTRDSFDNLRARLVTDGSRTVEGTMAGVCWQSVGRRVRITLGKYTTIFQAEVYAVLAFVYEIQTQIRPEKYVSICYNSWAALKVLRASKRKSPLVQQC